jgi:hypothetical protein
MLIFMTAELQIRQDGENGCFSAVTNRIRHKLMFVNEYLSFPAKNNCARPDSIEHGQALLNTAKCYSTRPSAIQPGQNAIQPGQALFNLTRRYSTRPGAIQPGQALFNLTRRYSTWRENIR